MQPSSDFVGLLHSIPKGFECASAPAKPSTITARLAETSHFPHLLVNFGMKIATSEGQAKVCDGTSIANSWLSR
jgi:hypothetical protein